MHGARCSDETEIRAKRRADCVYAVEKQGVFDRMIRYEALNGADAICVCPSSSKVL